MTDITTQDELRQRMEKMLLDFAKHTAYKQMVANERIKNLYQLDNSANIDVEYDVKSVAQYIEAYKDNAVEMALKERGYSDAS